MSGKRPNPRQQQQAVQSTSPSVFTLIVAAVSPTSSERRAHGASGRSQGWSWRLHTLFGGGGSAAAAAAPSSSSSALLDATAPLLQRRDAKASAESQPSSKPSLLLSPRRPWRLCPNLGAATAALLIAVLLFIAACGLDPTRTKFVFIKSDLPEPLSPSTLTCPQPPALGNHPLLPRLAHRTAREDFVANATSRFSQAVQIPTFADAEGGAGDGFLDLQRLLTSLYPLSHARMARQVLLKSVVYTYPGRNPSLKPILLCAHFDTVPVDANAMQRWRFPPFSGKIYNNMIWGRGTADTKGTLIAIFEALETLIATGFEPSRTIVLAFGHDEETASSGAGAIAEFLDSTYGPNGIELIVDEGSTVTTMFGSEYAVVSTSEKGYVDLTLNVTTAGGHSSSPPPHTSIGILAHAIYALEKRPFAPKIQNAKDHPLTRHLTCLALDERSTLDRSVRQQLAGLLEAALAAGGAAERNRAAAEAAEEKLAEFLAAHPSLMPDSEPVLTTTQAVNIIGGGASPNSLPESAASLVNYRVAMHMTVQDVVDAVAGTLKDVAAAHGILLFAGAASSSSALSFSSTYRSYGVPEHLLAAESRKLKVLYEPPPRPPRAAGAGAGAGEGAAVGELALLTNPGVIHPAPVTPSTGPVWDQLAGVVRAVFRGPDGRPPFVVPAVLVGNTDTNNYLSLSRHIFRFSPMRTDGGENLHTVDEHLRVSSFVEAIEFYQLLVLEFDGTSAAAADS